MPLLAEWGCTAGRGVPPFVREAVDCALAESASRELVIHSGEREISFQVTPVAGHDYANLYGRDITESRRAERALRESEALLRAICDTTADYVFLKDREGRYLLANPAAAGHVRQARRRGDWTHRRSSSGLILLSPPLSPRTTAG